MTKNVYKKNLDTLNYEITSINYTHIQLTPDVTRLVVTKILI